jgi:hypothetical protein
MECRPGRLAHDAEWQAVLDSFQRHVERGVTRV